LALSQTEFNHLVDDHAPALYRTAFRMTGNRHEAEDMVQETFRSAWKSRLRYDSDRGSRAWLVAILRRRICDRLRRKAQPVPLHDDSPIEIATQDRDPFFDEYTDEMQSALGLLNEELRETLLLVVVGELTHQEVADLLQLPIGTVLSRVSRARKRLREFLMAVSKK